MNKKLKLTSPDPELDRLAAGTIDGMAHWSGSGPPGTTCGECRFWANEDRPNHYAFRCAKYFTMMKKWGSRHIPFHQPSCKYFRRD